MTYTEREIARLEGMKDGLIKKLVDECEEINDQITALRKGIPRKKDSQIYFERGYKQGKEDAFELVNVIVDAYNKSFKDITTAEMCMRKIDELIKEHSNG